jgi:hypothetical protein
MSAEKKIFEMLLAIFIRTIAIIFICGIIAYCFDLALKSYQ